MIFRIALLHSVLLACGTALRSRYRAPPKPEKQVFGPESTICQKNAKSRHRHRHKVIGGTVVNESSEFPFMAWIGDYDGTGQSQYCGGSLISERLVLTAAHCLYTKDSRNANVYVRLNVTDFGSARAGLARGIINWKQHEGYDPYSMFNDLALVLLNESVPLKVTAPVTLSNGTLDIEKIGGKEIVGWGSMNEDCSRFDTLLRKAQVPLGTSGSRCKAPGSRELGPKVDFDFTRQLCAGKFEGKMRYPGCGDSGGPLLASVGGAKVQVGLVSWTYGKPWPDVFTRVSFYKNWINETSEALLAEGRKPFVDFPYW